MTIEKLGSLNDKKIYILGEEWTIKVVDTESKNVIAKTLKVQSASMLTQLYRKEIWVSINDYISTDETQQMPNNNPAIDQDLTHELYHAFYYESGLDSSAILPDDEAWPRNETMIDWSAKMFPKILKVRRALGISDNF